MGTGSITVTATGTVQQYPAQGLIYLYVNGTGNTEQIANDNLSLTLEILNSSILKYIGGNLSNIVTQNYYMNKVKNSSEYQVVEYLQITVTNVKNMSTALSTISKINNTYVTGAYAQLSAQQITNMRTNALSQALSNATNQAETLENNASVKVENITIGQPHFPVFIAAETSSASSRAQSGQIFYSGEQSLTETITATFIKS